MIHSRVSLAVVVIFALAANAASARVSARVYAQANDPNDPASSEESVEETARRVLPLDLPPDVLDESDRARDELVDDNDSLDATDLDDYDDDDDVGAVDNVARGYQRGQLHAASLSQKKRAQESEDIDWLFYGGLIGASVLGTIGGVTLLVSVAMFSSSAFPVPQNFNRFLPYVLPAAISLPALAIFAFAALYGGEKKWMRATGALAAYGVAALLGSAAICTCCYCIPLFAPLSLVLVPVVVTAPPVLGAIAGERAFAYLEENPLLEQFEKQETQEEEEKTKANRSPPPPITTSMAY